MLPTETTNRMNKPKRGDCGTCHWFEMGPQQPPKGPKQGSCLVNPPVPVMGQQQRIKGLGPNGPEMEIMQIQIGMLPPTQEDRRCALWRPAGANLDITRGRLIDAPTTDTRDSVES